MATKIFPVRLWNVFSATVCLTGCIIGDALGQANPPTIEKAALPFTNPADPLSLREGRMKRKVEEFDKVFQQMVEARDVPFAMGFLYTNDYTFIGPDGKRADRSQQIASVRATPVTTASYDKPDDNGVKAVAVAEKDAYWRKPRYEFKDGLIVEYKSPVRVSQQSVPAGTNGATKKVTVKTMYTLRREFVLTPEGKVFLKKEEFPEMVMYVNGKKQPKAVVEGRRPPVL